ncbi:TonB-dependent receptor [Longimicrobium sp.]|uniref:TonB-dependent receptor n=1 Tax=Longimicrobium sp. TaxID=2029185 RepID=UPI002E2EC08E|nr:carboxypeptidase regulatory-like domain-containing protein [Longimicrobium sp.]HEX6040097.1 carboxypeptidase regulatory-like domain-containing protein [Longimicrobium sp.]
MMGRALVWLTLVVSVVLVAPAAAAQGRVAGRIVDAQTGEAVQGASVSMMSSEGRFRRLTDTDGNGVFVFEEITPGRFRLNAARMGYVTVQGSYVDLAQNDTVVVDIRMSSDGVLLQPVTVVARSAQRSSPMLRAFYERMDRGIGQFISRDDIAARNPMYVTDLLATVPGVRLGAWTPAGRQVYMSRSIKSGPEGCPVQFFVDNVHVNRTNSLMEAGANQRGRDTTAFAEGALEVGRQPSIDEFVNPSAIEGIEVYPGLGSVPAEFMSPDARCGTVVVWTKRGYQD